MKLRVWAAWGMASREGGGYKLQGQCCMLRFRSLPGYTCHLIGTCPLSAIGILNLIIISILGTELLYFLCGISVMKMRVDRKTKVFLVGLLFIWSDISELLLRKLFRLKVLVTSTDKTCSVQEITKFWTKKKNTPTAISRKIVLHCPWVLAPTLPPRGWSPSPPPLPPPRPSPLSSSAPP